MLRRIWLDLETTGLDVNQDVILEVGVVVAEEFDIISSGSWLVHDSSFRIQDLDPCVVDMHTKNNLFKEAEVGGKPLAAVENDLVWWLTRVMPAGAHWKLAGSSIHFDRKFIDKYMLKLSERLHYQMLDVTAVRESLLDWEPKIVNSRPREHSNHRALSDCFSSLSEWKYYKNAIFNRR